MRIFFQNFGFLEKQFQLQIVFQTFHCDSFFKIPKNWKKKIAVESKT